MQAADKRIPLLAGVYPVPDDTCVKHQNGYYSHFLRGNVMINDELLHLVARGLGCSLFYTFVFLPFGYYCFTCFSDRRISLKKFAICAGSYCAVMTVYHMFIPNTDGAVEVIIAPLAIAIFFVSIFTFYSAKIILAKE